MAADRSVAFAAVAMAALVLAAPVRAERPPAASFPSAPSAASVAADGAPLLAKPAALAKRPAPTHAWHDGAVRRPLSVDPALRADFTPRADGRAGVLRAADGPLKDVPAALQSPVLRDEAGRARALPGGVVVVLAETLDDAATRALLARHGVASAEGARRTGERSWLVPTAPGLPSLELANRLADSGTFAAAQPNWWVARTLK
jgi:hypothetical protein